MSMLFGSGAIYNRFIDFHLQSSYLIFAGGVNNSRITDENMIYAEEIAIKAALIANPDVPFVFFSSCSILDPDMKDSPYVLHKLRMEKLIEKSANKFFIFRLPQLLALSDNNMSLVNFLVDAITNQKTFELWGSAQRNLIDLDDVYDIVCEVIKCDALANKVINVASPYSTSVVIMVREIEDFIGLPALYTFLDKGADYEIDISEIRHILIELQIDFGPEYLKKSLGKYISHIKYGPKILSLIVPTYNEENGIDEFYRRSKHVLNLLSPRFEHEIIFVNDCSTDDTLKNLNQLALADTKIKLISFSRNFGNQIAISAGIDFSSGHIAIIIDDDLQDPPEIMLNLIAKWDKGYKVVYGVRPKRNGVNKLFKLTAKLYYRVMETLSETKLPKDTGDFRLIDRVVIEVLKNMKEENRYYRGMVSWVGFPQIGVNYVRDKRYAGVSTFSFLKYVNFAFNGLTAFTDKPLYFSSLLGLAITIFSFILASVLIINKLIDPSVSIKGWTSLTVIFLFFGGVQLISIGVLGIYIAKIYREVKDRPLYIIESTKNIKVNPPF